MKSSSPSPQLSSSTDLGRGTARKPLLRNLLFARFEWMEAQVVERAKQRGYFVASGAMNKLLSHLGAQPIGLSELARRVGVSRQAVHQIATEAASAGIVEFVTSETDKRVKLLQYTARGRELVAQAAADFKEIEREVAAAIGQEDLETLRRILAKPWSTGSA